MVADQSKTSTSRASIQKTSPFSHKTKHCCSNCQQESTDNPTKVVHIDAPLLPPRPYRNFHPHHAHHASGPPIPAAASSATTPSLLPHSTTTRQRTPRDTKSRHRIHPDTKTHHQRKHPTKNKKTPLQRNPHRTKGTSSTATSTTQGRSPPPNTEIQTRQHPQDPPQSLHPDILTHPNRRYAKIHHSKTRYCPPQTPEHPATPRLPNQAQDHSAQHLRPHLNHHAPIHPPHPPPRNLVRRLPPRRVKNTQHTEHARVDLTPHPPPPPLRPTQHPPRYTTG